MTKHGHFAGGHPTPEYGAWQRMWSRVRGSANAKAKKNYQDRGITVDERWRDFRAFLADMGPRPQGTSLDRRDNALGYGPDNCRWASFTEQQRNRRGNRLITCAGETLCLAAWAERTGLTRETIQKRLKRGVPVEDALKNNRTDRERRS